MTLFTLASLKGSPGVTTLACLVGASWAVDRRVVVVESDSCGSDLAPRFGLVPRTGWGSLASAARRLPAELDIEAHLQELPGGLEVLVGTGGDEPVRGGSSTRQEAEQAVLRFAVTDDVLVDAGRLLPGDPRSQLWLARSAVVALAARNDAASIVHLRDHAPEVLDRCNGRAAVVLVGADGYPPLEVASFTGLSILAQIPFEPEAAAVATTGRGSHRRLQRSGLAMAASRLADQLLDAAAPLDGSSGGGSTRDAIGGDTTKGADDPSFGAGAVPQEVPPSSGADRNGSVFS